MKAGINIAPIKTKATIICNNDPMTSLISTAPKVPTSYPVGYGIDPLKYPNTYTKSPTESMKTKAIPIPTIKVLIIAPAMNVLECLTLTSFFRRLTIAPMVAKIIQTKASTAFQLPIRSINEYKFPK